MTTPTPTLAEIVAELRELEAKATPAPWKAGRTDIRSYLGNGEPVHYIYRGDAETEETRIRIVSMPGTDTDPTDEAMLLVRYRNALPDLLAAAERGSVYIQALGDLRADIAALLILMRVSRLESSGSKEWDDGYRTAEKRLCEQIDAVLERHPLPALPAPQGEANDNCE